VTTVNKLLWLAAPWILLGIHYQVNSTVTINNTAPLNVSSLATLSGQLHCSYKCILLGYTIRSITLLLEMDPPWCTVSGQKHYISLKQSTQVRALGVHVTWSEYRCAPLETVAVFSGCVCTVWSFFVVFGPTKRLCRAVDSVRKKAHTHTHTPSLPHTHTIIHCKENSNDLFPEIKLRGLVPNFHIYTSVSDLYILRISLHILLQPNRQTNRGNK